VVSFLARHEWRLLTANAVVQLVVLVFSAALLLAALLGVARTEREQRTFETFTARALRQRAHPPSMRADAVANETGWLALLPPAPLGALAAGQSDVYPSYLKVTARNLDSLVTGDQVEHPFAVAAGQLDVAFIVLFFYPLLIFAVSFDLTATERDRGTLRMLLAQPVRLRDLVVGKMLARALLLSLPVVAIPVVIMAAASAFAQRAMADEQAVAVHTSFASLTVWMGAVLAYGSIWYGIALIVNARGWNAAANALVLAGIWLLFAVVGPATINLLIAVVYPMPSRVEAAVQARAATGDATVQGSRQLGQFLQDHPTSANVGREGMRQFAALQAARDRQIADRLQAVEAAFDAQLRRQRRLASWLSVLSPTMVAQQVLLESAGTSASRFEHFERSAAAFQERWKAYFEPRVLDAATLTETDILGSPTFAYSEPPASQGLSRVAPAVVGMTGAGVALLWLGLRRYRMFGM
jgi:ABC-2 type transport system permease protein